MCVTAAKDGVLIRRRLRVFAAAVALVLLCAVCVGGVSGADVWNGTSIDIDWAGSGTQANPYLITSASELAGLSGLVNSGEDYSGKYFRLTTHILLNNDSSFNAVLKQDPTLSSQVTNLYRWSPIGTEDNPFMGTFDGGGYSIGNVYSTFGDGGICGLFGHVKGGTLQNINLLQVLLLPTAPGNQKPTIGALVGWLEGGVVKDCHVVLVSKYGVENSGSNPGIGGLIGKITYINDDDVISESDIGDYLQGGYSVAVLDVTSKKSGLIVGQPSIGESKQNGGFADSTASYTVHIYEMDLNGQYITKDTRFYISTIGASVNAEYVVPEGFSLDTSIGTYQGTVTKDNSLVLSVYLKRNKYTLTVRSDGAVVSTSTPYYGAPLTPPSVSKPGCELVGWNPMFPSTMPARDLTIEAIWNIVSPIFTIIIPDGLPLSNETYDGGTSISADIVQIPDSGTLILTVRSLNDFHLVLENHPDITLPYQLFIDSLATPVVQDEEVGRFTEAQSVQIPLSAKMTGTPRYSGSYADSLTFTVRYVET